MPIYWWTSKEDPNSTLIWYLKKVNKFHVMSSTINRVRNKHFLLNIPLATWLRHARRDWKRLKPSIVTIAAGYKILSSSFCGENERREGRQKKVITVGAVTAFFLAFYTITYTKTRFTCTELYLTSHKQQSKVKLEKLSIKWPSIWISLGT